MVKGEDNVQAIKLTGVRANRAVLAKTKPPNTFILFTFFCAINEN